MSSTLTTFLQFTILICLSNESYYQKFVYGLNKLIRTLFKKPPKQRLNPLNTVSPHFEVVLGFYCMVLPYIGIHFEGLLIFFLCFIFSPFQLQLESLAGKEKSKIVSKIKSYSCTLSLQRLPPLTLWVSFQFLKKIFFIGG